MRDLHEEATLIYRTVRQPGTTQVSDATDVESSPDGRFAVFSGAWLDALEGWPTTRICRVDLTSGDLAVLSHGPNHDRHPRYSPDGRYIAFLSDRRRSGDFQLFLLDCGSGNSEPASPIENGWVESLQWSHDSTQILLGVAGHGADLAGAQGGVRTSLHQPQQPSWKPRTETGHEAYRWRRAWAYDVRSGRLRQLSDDSINVWETVWCGSTSIVAIVSGRPDEGAWYNARVVVIDTETGALRELFKPRDQLGVLTASQTGRYVAIVEALCSDRLAVAGNLLLIEASSGRSFRPATQAIDVTHLEWLSDDRLLVAGHRGFESVLGLYYLHEDHCQEVWRSDEITTPGICFRPSALGDSGDAILIGEGFVRAPEIATIRQGRYGAVRSFDLGYAQVTRGLHAAEPTAWMASDGLEIQGWLLRPRGPPPHPLLMIVHGGPVWQWRPTWLGRTHGAILMLLERGCAVFLPNPRGSTGRGAEFVRYVLGDMGGADASDCLSGIDHLVSRGLAAQRHLAVMGFSYGGFMTSWLIGHDQRFAAAISVSPMINYVTQHLLSNISDWVPLFLGDTYHRPGGEYHERSPLMYAHRARTPTLNICGALDRSAPAEEARQFHHALLEAGATSVLVTYPEEGHGVRKFPAVIDYAARVVSWIEQYMMPKSPEAKCP